MLTYYLGNLLIGNRQNLFKNVYHNPLKISVDNPIIAASVVPQINSHYRIAVIDFSCTVVLELPIMRPEAKYLVR